jgi:hypothetical protein
MGREQMALSAFLRRDGELLSKLGKEIEDSQVEDGDPPYEITLEQHRVLLKIIGEITSALDYLQVKR